MDIGLLVYAAIAGLTLLFFVWGLLVARARGRSGFMWGLACALTWVVGIAILYSLGERQPKVQAVRQASLADEQDLPDVDELRRVEAVFNPPPPPLAIKSEPAESDEDRRWRYLAEYHPDVRKAVSAVSLLGRPALDELKAAHLAIGDAALLPAIVQQLSERFRPGSPTKRNGAAGAVAQPAAWTPATQPPPAGEPDDDPLLLDNPTVKPDTKATPARTGEWPASWTAAAPGGADVNGASVAKPADLASGAASVRGPLGQRVAAAPPPPPPPAPPFVGDAPAVKADSDLTLQIEPETEDESDGTQADREILAGSEPAAPDAAAGDPDEGGEPGAQGETAMPDAPPPPALERTTVTPSDLQGAKYLETYAGVHLFGLADGRIFVDRHEARATLAQARELVDKAAARRPGA